MISIVHRDFSFVAIVESVIKFRAAILKEHGASFVAARMVDIVGDIILSDFLSGNSPHKYKR